MNSEDIVAEASKLPEEQRASIASRLLRGLQSVHHWVGDDEVEHRMREADQDPSVLMSFDEFVAGVNRHGS